MDTCEIANQRWCDSFRQRRNGVVEWKVTRRPDHDVQGIRMLGNDRQINGMPDGARARQTQRTHMRNANRFIDMHAMLEFAEEDQIDE